MPPELPPAVQQLVSLALAEDIGDGDVTARYFVPPGSRSLGRIVAREPGIAAGTEVATAVFLQIDPTVTVKVLTPDGAAFTQGGVLLEVEGPSASLLTAERTALNFLQRLSAIATQTHRYVEAIKPHPVKLLDTRKTAPGWRLLEKAAVKAGGGASYRIGLYDQVMVKDNHLLADDRLEDLQAAIDKVKADRPGILVELEADTLAQVRGFLTLRGVDVILLDNMKTSLLREAVAMNAGRVQLEASGGVTVETIGSIAATGVNAISVGALTHTVRALDLSLEFVPAE